MTNDQTAVVTSRLEVEKLTIESIEKLSSDIFQSENAVKVLVGENRDQENEERELIEKVAVL